MVVYIVLYVAQSKEQSKEQEHVVLVVDEALYPDWMACGQ